MGGRTAGARNRRRPPSHARRTARVDARDAVVDALRAKAGDESGDVRQAVAAALGEVGGAAARAALAPLLTDSSDRVRRAAVLALDRASGTGPAVAGKVRRFLSDPAPRVRAAAAVVLGRRRDRASVPALLARLDAPGTWEKPSVEVALGRIGDRRAVRPLIRLAQSPARWLRVCAVHALGEIGAVEARRTIRAGLADPAWSVRGAAATALGSVGTAHDARRLLELLDDPHPWPRRGAVYALGRLHRSEALGRLHAALVDPAPEVRVAACWALGELGDLSARRPLARFLSACPAPADGPRPSPPQAGGLPASDAEDRQLEAAVAALARLRPAAPDAEVDRAIDAAEGRLAAGMLERPARPVFAERFAGAPSVTLRQLFMAARSVAGATDR